MNIVEKMKQELVNYLPDDLKNASIQVTTDIKNNGLKKTGVVIRPAGSSIAQTIYLDKFLEQLEDGHDYNEVMHKIANIVVKNIPSNKLSLVLEKYKDFESAKNNIIVNVVNAARNEEFLANVPHVVVVGDLALFYKVMVETFEHGCATITISNAHMKAWGVTLDNIRTIAIENSERLMPSEMKTLPEYMIEMTGGMPNLMLEETADMPDNQQMFVITNEQRTHGASAIFYSNKLEELAERVNSNLYVIPGSIHDTLAVSAETFPLDELTEMLKNATAESVAIEDQLSDHVYFYDRATKQFFVA